MRRPLIVLAVVTALLGGLAPGASAAQRVRFEHRGDYVELGQTTMNFLPRRVEVRTMDLEGAQAISCVNRPCRQAGLDGTDFRGARNLRIFLEIPSDEFKGSDEELQAVVWGQSRATAIFTDGFESGDVVRVAGTTTCQRTRAGVQVCDVEMEIRGRVIPKGGGPVIGWTSGKLTARLRMPPSGVGRWTAMVEAGEKAIDADRFGGQA